MCLHRPPRSPPELSFSRVYAVFSTRLNGKCRAENRPLFSYIQSACVRVYVGWMCDFQRVNAAVTLAARFRSSQNARCVVLAERHTRSRSIFKVRFGIFFLFNCCLNTVLCRRARTCNNNEYSCTVSAQFDAALNEALAAMQCVYKKAVVVV